MSTTDLNAARERNARRRNLRTACRSASGRSAYASSRFSAKGGGGAMTPAIRRRCMRVSAERTAMATSNFRRAWVCPQCHALEVDPTPMPDPVPVILRLCATCRGRLF